MNAVSAACPRPYIPAIDKTVVKEIPSGGVNRVINLSFNESSLGPSPLAVAAAKAAADSLERYPDPTSGALRKAIGRRHGLDPERVICGNGSEELLDVIGRVYARPGDEILFPQYGFLQFPIVAMRVGATQATAPERNLTTDVDALLAALTPRTRIVFVANPNNPTGTYIDRDELRRLRDGLPPSVVLVIDSAYAEYVVDEDYSNGIDLVEGTDNVVVTRTFSKAYGLAAVRVGWAYGPRSMIDVLNCMRGIGNINAIAHAAAVAALDDEAFVERVREHARLARGWMTERLEGLGLEVVRGGANFVLVRFPDEPARNAAAAFARLASRGIITRSNEDYGLDEFLRITLGDDEENRLVIDALAEFLG